MGKFITAILGLLAVWLMITPILTPFIYNQQELSSITIDYFYEINIDDTLRFHYVLIPTNTFEIEESSNVSMYMEGEGEKHLIWQKDRNNPAFSNYSYLEEIYDETDTAWLNITFLGLDPNKNHRIIIDVDIQRLSSKAHYFSNRTTNKTLWLKPTNYIDSDHPLIVEKADELTYNENTRKEKVSNIVKYIKTLKYNISYARSEMWNSSSNVEEENNASDTLRIGEGVCLNFARLCVALCRASEIPARVIIGYYVTENKNIWDRYPVDGHAWVEFLETDDSWNILDPRDMIFKDLPLNYFQQIRAPYQQKSYFIEQEESFTFNLSAEGGNYIEEFGIIRNATLLIKKTPSYLLMGIYFGTGVALGTIVIVKIIRSRQGKREINYYEL